ncbi:MAG: putative colanic acid biosynthesis acetyltransferase [Methylococcales bacterium]|nr:putative colanic acid biosynthesis acetyltransferase [Methylococcales bacterium]
MNAVDLTKSISVWSLKIKLLRVVWFLFRIVFYLPKQFSPVRLFLLRLFGAKIGKACLICADVKIWMPWNLIIGDYVAIGKGVEIYNFGKVIIGNQSLISQRSYLCTASHDYTHSHYPLIWKDIEIGSQCWIAAEVFIGPGVKIGDGSVIGARSVVTKSIPNWQVCAGNPCVIIKERIVNESML